VDQRFWGAHMLIDHNQPMLAQLQTISIEQVEKLGASLTHTPSNYEPIYRMSGAAGPSWPASMIRQGPGRSSSLKPKCLSLPLGVHVLARRPASDSGTMIGTEPTLNRVAELVDKAHI